MNGFIVAACAITLVQASPAQAQSITAEASTSVGASTDEVSVVATQLRAFGEIHSSIRYYIEAAWGKTSDRDSDAFGAAFPYGNRLQIIESFGERIFQPHAMVIAVRAGRYRTPFGISSASDHAYSGFLRAPLIRYDGYFALSNNFLEHGGDIVIGVPGLTLETSVGMPADIGSAVRRSGLDTVFRVQGFAGPFIVGVSHIRTSPYLPEVFALGHSEFTGVDVRWMRDGIQFRGEWLRGRPFDGTSTTGWYADAIVHHVGMGRVTAVARVEQLDYNTIPEFAMHAHRQTVGARIRIVDGLSIDVNLLHNPNHAEEYRPTSVDIGATYSIRRH
jgi:hypothetical protein